MGRWLRFFLGLPPREDEEDIRYLGGLKPAKYFDEVVWPKHSETFEMLGFVSSSSSSSSRERAMEVFEAFLEIDDDNSGSISIEELHTWLGFTMTKFSQRVFGILDLDGSGLLDFGEFLIGVWNFSTYDAALLTKVAFSIFDVDGSGKLEMAECDALLRMVFNVRTADPALLERIDANGDGEISLEELEQVVEVDNYILQPAFDLQRALRQKVCGVRYWESETRRRRVYFSGYDAGSQSSWESIKLILQIKQKEREEKERDRAEIEGTEREKRALDAERREAQIKRELEERRRRRAAEQKAKREAEEAKAERAAEAAMEDAEARMDEECIGADLAVRLSQRETYWRAFETWVEKCREARLVRREKRLGMIAHDAETMLQESLEVDRSAFEREVTLHFAFDFRDGLVARSKSAWRVTLAKLLLEDHCGDGDYEPTNVARLFMRFATKASLATARERARSALLEELRTNHERKVLAELDAVDEDQEAMFETRRLEKVGERGGPDSKWERLWDAQSGTPYWYNSETAACTWERPHVCHHCDSAILVEDKRCFNCNTERSAYNQRRYLEEGSVNHRVDDDNVEGETSHHYLFLPQTTTPRRSSCDDDHPLGRDTAAEQPLGVFTKKASTLPSQTKAATSKVVAC